MWYWISAHIREEGTHKLVGIHAANYFIKDFVCNAESIDIEKKGNKATTAVIMRKILRLRKEAGVRTKGCYVHIIAICPLPLAHVK